MGDNMNDTTEEQILEKMKDSIVQTTEINKQIAKEQIMEILKEEQQQNNNINKRMLDNNE